MSHTTTHTHAFERLPVPRMTVVHRASHLTSHNNPPPAAAAGNPRVDCSAHPNKPCLALWNGEWTRSEPAAGPQRTHTHTRHDVRCMTTLRTAHTGGTGPPANQLPVGMDGTGLDLDLTWTDERRKKNPSPHCYVPTLP